MAGVTILFLDWSPESGVRSLEFGVHHSRSASHKKAQIYIYIDGMMPMGWASIEHVLLREIDWFRVRVGTRREKDVSFHHFKLN